MRDEADRFSISDFLVPEFYSGTHCREALLRAIHRMTLLWPVTTLSNCRN
jgi:hypothetical protein